MAGLATLQLLPKLLASADQMQVQFVFTGSVLGTVLYLLPARVSREELAVAYCDLLGAYLSGRGGAELGEVYLYSESDQSSCTGESLLGVELCVGAAVGGHAQSLVLYKYF